MKLLFIGDIVGEPGRRAVTTLLPVLQARHGLHAVIANGENAAGGNGITSALARELFAAGVDVITTGDHVWDQKDVLNLLASDPRVLRPLNYPTGVVGQGSFILRKDSLPPIAVINAQGRTFMPPLENPFPLVDAEANRLRRETPIVFLDFHAEATSEKIAMARWLDGKISGMIGTHTHVQTSDETILPGGTAYLTDAGFTGGQDGVIGRQWEPVVQRFLTGMPQRFEVSTGQVMLHGAVIEIEATTGRAIAIQRVAESLPG